MAPLPVIQDVFRVAWEWTAGGDTKAVNVMHFYAPSKSPTEIFTVIDGTITQNCFAAVSSSANVDNMKITPLAANAGTEEFPVTNANVWTGAGGEEFIPAVSCLIKLSTPFRGRSFRGRLYLPFVGESQQNGGLLNQTVVTDCQGAWEDLQVSLLAFGIDLVVASYKLEEATTVTKVTCERPVATQRRRQDRLRI